MTLKTNKKIECTSLSDARTKADKITNAVIIKQDDRYYLVNYKTFEQLLKIGYKQIR